MEWACESGGAAAGAAAVAAAQRDRYLAQLEALGLPADFSQALLVNPDDILEDWSAGGLMKGEPPTPRHSFAAALIDEKVYTPP